MTGIISKYINDAENVGIIGILTYPKIWINYNNTNAVWVNWSCRILDSTLKQGFEELAVYCSSKRDSTLEEE